MLGAEDAEQLVSSHILAGSFGGEVGPELVDTPPLAVFEEGLLHVDAGLGGGVEYTDETGVLGLGLGEEPARHAVGIAGLHPGEVEPDAELAPLEQLEADIVCHAFGDPSGDIRVGLEYVDELMDNKPDVLGVRGDPLCGDVDGFAVPVGDAVHLAEDDSDGCGMDFVLVGAKPEGVGHHGFPLLEQGLRLGREGLEFLIRPLLRENDLHLHRNGLVIHEARPRRGKYVM